VRPDWQVTAFDLAHGEFPETFQGFDGILIGGSPSSVHDDDPWIARLTAIIRDAYAQGLPMAGACFGHQIIARALGGQVGANPHGWVFGRITTDITAPARWMDGPASIALAAAHSEQVTALPPGATVLARSEGCPVAAYAIGAKVFATQHHPEITDAFLAALTDEYAPHLPPAVAARARASLTAPVEGARFAEWLARFFETAAQDKAASKSIAVN
jgi:GMP synthase-like glutamine amidotransferase